MKDKLLELIRLLETVLKSQPNQKLLNVFTLEEFILEMDYDTIPDQEIINVIDNIHDDCAYFEPLIEIRCQEPNLIGDDIFDPKVKNTILALKSYVENTIME